MDLGILDIDVVDQPEIHDVDRDFRVVAILQDREHFVLGYGHGHASLRRGGAVAGELYQQMTDDGRQTTDGSWRRLQDPSVVCRPSSVICQKPGACRTTSMARVAS